MGLGEQYLLKMGLGCYRFLVQNGLRQTISTSNGLEEQYLLTMDLGCYNPKRINNEFLDS